MLFFNRLKHFGKSLDNKKKRGKEKNNRKGTLNASVKSQGDFQIDIWTATTWRVIWDWLNTEQGSIGGVVQT